MKKHAIAIILFCVFCLPFSAVKAQDFPDGADLLIEAVRYRAGNHTLVRSLSYVTEQTYRRPTLTMEEIEKKAADEEAGVRKDFADQGLPPPPYIDQVRDHARKRYLDNAVLSRYTVKYKAPSLSQKMFSLQIEREGGDQAKWTMDTSVIESNVVSDKSESEGVLWFPQGRSAEVGDSQYYKEPFLNFGRLQGPPVVFMHLLLFQDADIEKYEFSETNIAKFKAERDKQLQLGNVKGLITVGTTTYDGDARAYIVESSTSDDTVVERYWIDVNRGFVCPLLQYYDEKGTLLSEYKSEDYFLHEKSGLWFPQLYREMTTDQEGKQEFKEYRIDQSSLDVNFPIADEEFAVEITENSTVTDVRKGKGSKRYKAMDNGVLSLGKGGLDLDNMDWLRATGMPLQTQAMSWWRSACIIIGVVLITLGIYYRFRREK